MRLTQKIKLDSIHWSKLEIVLNSLEENVKLFSWNFLEAIDAFLKRLCFGRHSLTC